MGFSSLKISTKYPLIIVVLALLATLVTATVAYTESKFELRAAEQRKLVALLLARKAALNAYFYSVKSDVELLASGPLTRRALRKFSKAWDDLGANAADTLQTLYIHDNPFAPELRGNLESASDDTQYTELHGWYHPLFRHFQRKSGYYDFLLFRPDGYLIYSVSKELDFATNAINGRWHSTGLGKAFRAARNNPTVDFQAFIDFHPYEPSNGEPAGFISTPILDENGALLGVLALQISIEQIDQIMQVTAGMGETGETYIVGGDRLMRSNSRFSENSTILKTRVDMPVVDKALDGKAGIEVIPGYRGASVLSAYAPFEFLNVKWAILADVNESEVMEPIRRMQTFMLIAGIVIGILVSVAGVYLARGLTRPMEQMTAVVSCLAKDELDVEIPSRDRGDEIGEMASAVQVLKEYATERKVLLDELQQYRERIAGELEMARETQQVLMPSAQDVVRVAQKFGLGIDYHFESSSELGGDFWDLYALDDNRLGLITADFSGHGVNAALNVFRLHTLIDQLGTDVVDPARYLTDLNQSIAKLLERGEFVTMFCGIIDITTDTMIYAAAGCPPPIVHYPNQESPVFIDSRGIPLGVLDHAVYATRSVDFPPGTLLFLYSDALIESPDQSGARPDQETLRRRIENDLNRGFNERLLKTIIGDFLASLPGQVPDDLTAISIWRP